MGEGHTDQVKGVCWMKNTLRPAVFLFQVRAAYFDRVNLSANGFYK